MAADEKMTSREGAIGKGLTVITPGEKSQSGGMTKRIYIPNIIRFLGTTASLKRSNFFARCKRFKQGGRMNVKWNDSSHKETGSNDSEEVLPVQSDFPVENPVIPGIVEKSPSHLSDSLSASELNRAQFGVLESLQNNLNNCVHPSTITP